MRAGELPRLKTLLRAEELAAGQAVARIAEASGEALVRAHRREAEEREQEHASGVE
jgi:hypothetical protein